MMKSYSEKAMAPHSSTLVRKIPWMEQPGGLQSMGPLRIRHDWATSLSLFTFMHWRRKWQPTPGFLLGESQGWGIDIPVLYHQSHDVTNVLNSINVWERLSYKSAAHSVIQILVPVHELFVTNRWGDTESKHLEKPTAVRHCCKI